MTENRTIVLQFNNINKRNWQKKTFDPYQRD